MMRILTHKTLTLGVGLGIALWAASAQAVPTAVTFRTDVNAAIGDATTTTEMFDNDIPAEVGRDDLGIRSLDDAATAESDVDGVDRDGDEGLPTLTEVVPFPVIGILLAALGLLAVRRRSGARLRTRAGTPPS